MEKHVDEIKAAMTIRLVEQKLLELFTEGKLFGTVHTSIGQEMVGIAVARNLRSDDYVFSNHRCHGHFIAYCDDVEGLIAEIMGKATGVCAGFGGSQHLHKGRFFSNGIQGGIAPVAAGLAMSQKILAIDGITVVFIGDGTLGQGVLYETMNLAAKWELPLIFVLENNMYAQSTSQKQTLAGEIEARFNAFGIPSFCSNTWEWENLFTSLEKSVQQVRKTRKPVFHQVDTFRLMAHSKGDDNRPEELVAHYRERDPLNRLMAEYKDAAWLKSMLFEINARIEKAVAIAEDSPFVELSDLVEEPSSRSWETRGFEKERVVSAIRNALGEALEKDDRIVIIGEDIESPYGGAFKATANLSERYPDKVRNTPISEAAITGMGNGLALGGLLPVVEIMFGDFLALAEDQWINHAAKFSAMYNQKVKAPVVIRTPMGGKRGYGPTHSQSLEKIFLGFPGTQVLCLHHRYNPRQLYRSLFASIDRPTLVIENKILYAQYVDPNPPPGYRLCFNKDIFPVARLKPSSHADLTIVGIGGMSLDCEQALNILFEQEEVVVDLFLPSRIYPFDCSFMIESLNSTRRLIVVEEGQGFVSLSSEILSQVAETHSFRGVALARVTAAPRPVPAARPLEEKCLPSVDAIIKKALEIMNA